MRTAMVTESASNLPAGLASERGIYVCPLYVIWGEDVLKDGVDIQEAEFYSRLRQNHDIPKTSQVSARDFVEMFELAREREQADAVVCGVISSDMSGTYASALQAKAAVDFPVHVVDSQQVSWALGHAMLSAAEMRDSGAPAAAIACALAESAERQKLLFTIESLEYLHRGGRIGQARLLLGSALSIKPVLEVREGIVHSTENVRTRRRALDEVIKLAKRYSGGRPVKRLTCLHCDVEDEAESLLTHARDELQPLEEARITYATTVIGVHAGPGAVGLVVEYEGDSRG